MMKKADILLLVSVLTICALFTLGFVFFRTEPSVAVVYNGNEEYCRLPLNTDTTIFTDYMTITVKNGEVFVENSYCPDKICVNTPAISHTGEQIICLPQQIRIEVE